MNNIFLAYGTPGYIPPADVLKYDANNKMTYYENKFEIFSLGCIFF
jgi:hypothetical protein